jgi:hypothetical protein
MKVREWKLIERHLKEIDDLKERIASGELAPDELELAQTALHKLMGATDDRQRSTRQTTEPHCPLPLEARAAAALASDHPRQGASRLSDMEGRRRRSLDYAALDRQ